MITDQLTKMQEPTDARYTCSNTGGVEHEVGEFLYGLVRMIKPGRILETGTHKGISASYMADALKKNGFGKITTIEFERIHYNDANNLFTILGLVGWIESLLQDVNSYVTNEQFDFIFLDTEPNLRFAEFMRYWPNLKPGGLIAIHDLAPHMGQTGSEVNGMMNWPFGTLPDEIKELMKSRQLSNFHFNTPRGLYIGQKVKEDFYKI